MFLTGDHNLGGHAQSAGDGVFHPLRQHAPLFAVWLGTNFRANTGPAWMDNQHSKQGNIGMADGSVQGWSRSRLQDALKNRGDTGRHAAELPACYRVPLPPAATASNSPNPNNLA